MHHCISRLFNCQSILTFYQPQGIQTISSRLILLKIDAGGANNTDDADATFTFETNTTKTI